MWISTSLKPDRENLLRYARTDARCAEFRKEARRAFIADSPDNAEHKHCVSSEKPHAPPSKPEQREKKSPHSVIFPLAEHTGAC